MNSLITFALLATSALAAPHKRDEPSPGNNKVACDDQSRYSVSYQRGPQAGTVIPAACDDIFCPKDSICIQSIEHSLGTKPMTSAPQDANVSEDSNSIPGWGAQFIVTPPSEHDGTLLWTRDDCKNYFMELVTYGPQRGCMGWPGVHPGNLTVGDGKLHGTVFQMNLVPMNTTTRPSATTSPSTSTAAPTPEMSALNA